MYENRDYSGYTFRRDREGYQSSLFAGLRVRQEKLRKSGYDCSLPANYFLATGEGVDGRKIGCGAGTGQSSAVSPQIGEPRGAIRVYGGDVTIIAPASWGKDVVIGPAKDIAAFVRRWAVSGEWDCYSNEGAEPHAPSFAEHLLRMADALEALDLSQFPVSPTGPLVRRPDHNGHRDGVLR